MKQKQNISNFFFGHIMLVGHQHKQQNVETSNYYAMEFLKLLKHYEILKGNQLKQFKSMLENDTFQINRDCKIANQKMYFWQQRLQNLQKQDDNKLSREIIKLQLNQKIISSLDILNNNQQELEILNFKSQLKKDKQLQQQYQEQQEKPIPKMKVWNIQKPTMQPQFFDPHCQNCQTEAEFRQNHVAEVWQPNAARLPNMTLEEFADSEMKFAKDQEVKMKKAQEEQLKLEQDKDDDKDYWADQQTSKDRNWDDWKDDNEKELVIKWVDDIQYIIILIL
ncbi:unnamed protein product (macronuclear) [Paramecium tetraurelia]|uniref:Uncharacterized protein n=1 Tax=Paramecium tetraurelia TaxID=5888 RepID=A0CJT5_PARTE|nr:uncharacterized protein GSPATT00000764001 [Paramecium tetraurelia]CAK71052.1 unnamed protein product [Paramecium tetraurelia]|eukprot:XP_001438449.1 hypothetical protein (macronuclear) [Paramecium tetraurelia strain d4-2]